MKAAHKPQSTTMNKQLLINLLSLLSDETPDSTVCPAPTKISGQHIAVLDRGFVYVGDISDEGEYLKLTNASNIRAWGTSKGLGELVNGPLPQTKLDVVGIVLIPKRALIHLVPCKGF